MSSPLAQIHKLQKLDIRLDELDAELAHLPIHVAEIEQKLKVHRSELETQKVALAENEKERRTLEGQIQQLEQKASHLDVQLNDAKTNEQYRAFRSEIAFARKEIQKAEDTVLDKMESAQAFREKAEAAEKALAEEEVVVAAEVKETTARFKGDQDERERVGAERAELAKEVDASVLRVYERVRRKLKGRALSPLEGDRCTSCHMVVRLQLLQQLRTSDRLIMCEFCGCIIHLPTPDAGLDGDPPEDPAGDAGVA